MGGIVQQSKAELARRELATRRLKYFLPYVFPGYKVKPHNQLICDAIDLCVEGLIERLMIFCPPQYGKSEIVSRKLPAYYLGRYPEKRVIMASYAASLANELSRDARNLILSELYQNVFGARSLQEEEIVLSEDSRAIHAWNIDGHRGGMVAAGVTGGISGKSADLIIIDDPVKDDEEAMSALIQERNFNWYWGQANTRLSPNAPVILTMTRWHEEDLAGKLLKQAPEIGELWYVLRLSAVSETPDEIAHWCEISHVDEAHWLTREKVDRMLADVK